MALLVKANESTAARRRVYFDLRDATDGITAETIELDSPKAGPYFITVGPSGFEAFSSFSLSVTTEPAITAAPTGGPMQG